MEVDRVRKKSEGFLSWLKAFGRPGGVTEQTINLQRHYERRHGCGNGRRQTESTVAAGR